ncbi:hypothetical protein JL475_32590 [Streptomyces sp. M2CJ-2]|uniref:PASTA domain-containing protein n=1 Tax=Streptomyces sp. M2CJ-2 TaxID=2803948 RepID=UPI001929131E|nr:hypothetical protein [Streptomyces sp. M2CJ-2]MBL3670625.1 hypothetical protein [Streptomyces sp. M2CJ-2]
MRTRTTTVGILALLALTLTACEGTEDTGSSKPDTAVEDTSSQELQDTGAPDSDASADEPEAEAATLPDFTGQELQAAQDAAQAAGFYMLTSSDATGQGRMQVLDRNWTVCSQTPAPGEHPTDTTVNFDTVKIGESC